MTKAINNYVFKAMEEFDYNIEFAAEALNYALAYDENNTMALTLMGRLYAEKLFDYDTAIEYYKRVLAERINAFEVYDVYITALLNNEDYKEAEDFIDFALTIKGVDKAMLYINKALLNERLFNYKEAMKVLKKAEKYNYNTDFTYTVEEVKKRIKGKMPKKKKKKK
jgi:tetratricopeptide (TPR) repeat protein